MPTDSLDPEKILLNDFFVFSTNPVSSVGRASASELGGWGSIPGRDIPKSLKFEVAAPLLTLGIER